MKQDRDEDLSALLDGELDPAEAARLRAAMSAEPRLAREWAALQGVDEALRRAAQDAAFEPVVTLPAPAATPAAARAIRWDLVIGGLPLLLAARLLPKLPDGFWLGLAVEAFAGVAILALVVALAREAMRGQAVTG